MGWARLQNSMLPFVTENGRIVLPFDLDVDLRVRDPKQITNEKQREALLLSHAKKVGTFLSKKPFLKEVNYKNNKHKNQNFKGY